MCYVYLDNFLHFILNKIIITIVYICIDKLQIQAVHYLSF